MNLVKKYQNYKIIILIFITTTTINAKYKVSELLPKEITKSNYIFVIDINQQTNHLYYKNTLISSYKVSTGSKTRYQGNRELSEGIWRLKNKISEEEIKKRFKNNYEIYGPRLISLEKYNEKTNTFIKTNKAFHGTNEPENIGKPTSMGCIYHTNHDILSLYSFIPENTIVISLKN